MSEMASDPLRNHLVYPADRRMWLHIRRPYLLVAVAAALLPVAAAWIYYFVFGLPVLAPSPRHVQASIDNPIGFPAWLRLTHFVNLSLMLLLVRSGLRF